MRRGVGWRAIILFDEPFEVVRCLLYVSNTGGVGAIAGVLGRKPGGDESGGISDVHNMRRMHALSNVLVGDCFGWRLLYNSLKTREQITTDSYQVLTLSNQSCIQMKT